MDLRPSALGPRLLRVARTLRNLKPKQLFFLVQRRLQRWLPMSVPDPGPVRFEGDDRLAAVIAEWLSPESDSLLAVAERVMKGEFTFLGRTHAFRRIPWRDSPESLLWAYNLHYFDYALALAFAYRETGHRHLVRRFEGLALDWIDRNPVGSPPGWDAYPVSVRLGNWAYALALFGTALEQPGPILRSIGEQAGYLERRLEFHVQGNHLLRNYKALAVVGLMMSGGRCTRWARRGLAGLEEELEKQVLPDGGHSERSPMYHAMVLTDAMHVEEIARWAGTRLPRGQDDRIDRMMTAMAVMVRPDGRIHLFNDAALGEAPARVMERAVERARLAQDGNSGPRMLELPETGLFGADFGSGGARLLIDAGAPGPAHQPGHAHCDLLSFELDLAGRQVVVDSGTSGYAGDRLRHYVRSTRAHNTVQIGGREQCEIWGTFRMARRPTQIKGAHWLDVDRYLFEGSYRPYWSSGIEHWRQVVLGPTSLRVRDRVLGGEEFDAVSFLHFHPDVRLVRVDGGYDLELGASKARLRIDGAVRWRLVEGATGPAQGWFCEHFGSAVPAPCVEIFVGPGCHDEFGYTITF